MNDDSTALSLSIQTLIRKLLSGNRLTLSDGRILEMSENYSIGFLVTFNNEERVVGDLTFSELALLIKKEMMVLFPA